MNAINPREYDAWKTAAPEPDEWLTARAKDKALSAFEDMSPHAERWLRTHSDQVFNLGMCYLAKDGHGLLMAEERLKDGFVDDKHEDYIEDVLEEAERDAEY